MKRELAATLRPFKPFSLRLGVTHEGHTRGWAHATLPSALAADAAVAALRGARLEPLSCVLRVERATDKRDTLYPSLTREQRLALRLDPVALFSCCDGWTADAITSLMERLMRLGAQVADGCSWSLVDGCACAGGNTLAFLRSADCSSLLACELDPWRAGALAHNVQLCSLPQANQEFSVHCGDFVDLFRGGGFSGSDVLFLDPPWGGTDYSSRSVIPADDLALGAATLAQLTREALLGSSSRASASLVALGTPCNYDDAALARHIVCAPMPGRQREDDRPLPFRLQFGVRILLVFLNPASLRFSFPTAKLDEIVAQLLRWNAARANEHHPRFFDWEKDGWVSLSRWKGMRTVAPLPPDASLMDVC